MIATFFSQPVVWSTSLVELLTITTVLAGGFTLYHKVECHQPGCHRLGHFSHGYYKLCRIHHPDVPSDREARKQHIQAKPNPDQGDSQMTHAYGWRRPLPGLTYPLADTSGITIAAEVDPRRHMPMVFDQGQLGSCTANATATCFQYDAIQAGKDCGVLSRRWIYHFEKALEHTLGQGDTGAMGHDAFTVAKHGIPDESLYPYSEDIEDVEAVPPDVEPRAYTLTRPVRSVAQSLTQIKRVLSAGQTIAFGFTVYESFEDEGWWGSGQMPMPAPDEGVLGGHEVLLVGYLKSDPHHGLVRNSWGSGWCMSGYFLMPWSFLIDAYYASDLRTIQR